MAKIQQTYLSGQQAFVDLAKSSKFFNPDDYQQALSTDAGDAYLTIAYKAGSMETPETFDANKYSFLTGSDKIQYVYNHYLQDKNEIDKESGKNIYNQMNEYFDYKVDLAKSQKIYDSLSDFEKTINTIGGLVGDVGIAIYGLVDDITDTLAWGLGTTLDLVSFGAFHDELSGGVKQALTTDWTGVEALQQGLEKFKQNYTAFGVDELGNARGNGLLTFVDDTITAVAKMLPLAIPGVGAVVYGASMAGAIAEDAVKTAPGVDLFNLTAYTTLMTGVEYGLEFLTAGFMTKIAKPIGKALGKDFVSSGMDIIGSKMLGKTYKGAKGGIFKEIGMNFGTEFFEEASSEFLGSCLEKWLINPERNLATFDEVLYAGLIGGVIGGGFGGVSYLSTSAGAINKETGEFSLWKDISEEDRKNWTKLTRNQTIDFRTSLGESVDNVYRDSLEDFYRKYNEEAGLTKEQAQEQHAREYSRAVKKSAKEQEKLISAGMVLSTILQQAGVQKFQNAVKFAEQTLEEQRALVRNYIEYTPNSEYRKAQLEAKMRMVYDDTSISIEDNLTAGQSKLAKEFATENGIKVYFANFGQKNGVDENHNIVVDANTIVLDNALYKDTDKSKIANRVAKELLTEAMSERNDIMTIEKLKALRDIIQPDNYYTGDVKEDKKSFSKKEKQQLANLLIFDEQTITKCLFGDAEMFKDGYKFLTDIVAYLKTIKKTDVTKQEYNMALKAMRRYQKILAKQSPNEQYYEDAKNYSNIDDSEFAFDGYAWEKKVFIPMKNVEAVREFSAVIDMNANLNDPIGKDFIFDKYTVEELFQNTDANGNQIFKPEFLTIKEGESFEHALQTYLMETYGVMLSPIDLYAPMIMCVPVEAAYSENIKQNIENGIKEHPSTVEEMYSEEFINNVKKYTGVDLTNTENIFGNHNIIVSTKMNTHGLTTTRFDNNTVVGISQWVSENYSKEISNIVDAIIDNYVATKNGLLNKTELADEIEIALNSKEGTEIADFIYDVDRTVLINSEDSVEEYYNTLTHEIQHVVAINTGWHEAMQGDSATYKQEYLKTLYETNPEEFDSLVEKLKLSKAFPKSVIDRLSTEDIGLKIYYVADMLYEVNPGELVAENDLRFTNGDYVVSHYNIFTNQYDIKGYGAFKEIDMSITSDYKGGIQSFYRKESFAKRRPKLAESINNLISNGQSFDGIKSRLENALSKKPDSTAYLEAVDIIEQIDEEEISPEDKLRKLKTKLGLSGESKTFTPEQEKQYSEGVSYLMSLGLDQKAMEYKLQELKQQVLTGTYQKQTTTTSKKDITVKQVVEKTKEVKKTRTRRSKKSGVGAIAKKLLLDKTNKKYFVEEKGFNSDFIDVLLESNVSKNTIANYIKSLNSVSSIGLTNKEKIDNMNYIISNIFDTNQNIKTYDDAVKVLNALKDVDTSNAQSLLGYIIKEDIDITNETQMSNLVDKITKGINNIEDFATTSLMSSTNESQEKVPSQLVEEGFDESIITDKRFENLPKELALELQNSKESPKTLANRLLKNKEAIKEQFDLSEETFNTMIQRLNPEVAVKKAPTKKPKTIQENLYDINGVTNTSELVNGLAEKIQSSEVRESKAYGYDEVQEYEVRSVSQWLREKNKWLASINESNLDEVLTALLSNQITGFERFCLISWLTQNTLYATQEQLKKLDTLNAEITQIAQYLSQRNAFEQAHGANPIKSLLKEIIDKNPGYTFEDARDLLVKFFQEFSDEDGRLDFVKEQIRKIESKKSLQQTILQSKKREEKRTAELLEARFELSELKTKTADLEARLKQAQQDAELIKEAQNKIADAETIENLKKELDKSKKDLTLAKQVLAGSKTSSEKQKQKIANLETSVKKLEKKIKSYEDQSKKLELKNQDIKNLQKLIKSFETTMEQLKTSEEALKEKTDAQDKLIAELNAEVNRLNTETKESVAAEVEELQDELEITKSDLEKANSKIKSMEERYTKKLEKALADNKLLVDKKYKAEVDNLTKQLETLKNNNASLREKMKSAKKAIDLQTYRNALNNNERIINELDAKLEKAQKTFAKEMEKKLNEQKVAFDKKLKGELNVKNAEIKRLKNTIKKQEQKLSQTQEKYAGYVDGKLLTQEQEKVEKLRLQIEMLETEIENTVTKDDAIISKLQQENEQLMSNMGISIKDFMKVKSRANRLEKTNNKHRRMLKKYQETIEALQTQTTQDAFEMQEMQDELNKLRMEYNLLLRKDYVGLLDLKMNELLESDTNRTENLQKVAEISKDVGQAIVNSNPTTKTLYDLSGNSVMSPKARLKISNWLENLNSWRYLAMLSSPATWARNGVNNTLMSMNDYIVQGMAKSFWKVNESNIPSGQLSYWGDYNQDFKDYVKETFGPYIKLRLGNGSQYEEQEYTRAKQEYAKAKSEATKAKWFNKLHDLEQKMLNDEKWTVKKSLVYLTDMLSGATDKFRNDNFVELKRLYAPEVKEITNEELYDLIKKTNPTLAELFKESISSSNPQKATIQLAITLKNDWLSIAESSDKNAGFIIEEAMRRSNKLFLKANNIISKKVNQLQNSDKAIDRATAATIKFFFPFIRMTVNTFGYIIDSSPIGAINGMIDLFKLKVLSKSEKAQAIVDYCKQEYRNYLQANVDVKNLQNLDEKIAVLDKEIDRLKKVEGKAEKIRELIAEQKELTTEREVAAGMADSKDFDKEFEEWYTKNFDSEVISILSGNYKFADKVYEQMYANHPEKFSIAHTSTNPYLRARGIEKIARGVEGTAMMIIGATLAALTGAFDIDDDDDYFGPVLKIGDLKFKLEDLSPFSGMFIIGGLLASDNVENKYGEIINFIVDQSMLNLLESSLRYSNSLGDFVTNQSISFTQQMIPTIVKQATKIIDNSKKDKSANNYFEKLFVTTLSNLPGFSYLVANKIDPYTGESVKQFESEIIIENILGMFLPVNVRYEKSSELEKIATEVDAKTSGFSGSYQFNDEKVKVTQKDKERISKFRANYIASQFELINSDKQFVTVKDDNGKMLTTKFSKLNDKQKQNVLNNLYSKAGTYAKVEYWTSNGGTYITNSSTELYNLKKVISNPQNVKLGKAVEYK